MIHRTPRRLGPFALCAFAALLWGCAADTNGDPNDGSDDDAQSLDDELVKKVDGVQDVYVRDRPKGMVIGRLYDDNTFDVAPSGSSVYLKGFARGNVQRCGYVVASSLKTSSQRATGDCTTFDPEMPGQVWTHPLPSGDADGVGFRLCRSTPAWENWDFANGRGVAHGAATLASNRLVKMRYRTRDGQGALINAGGGAEWVFVRWSAIRDCSPRLQRAGTY